MTTKAPRPRQVTIGSTLVIVGSVFIVLSAWERISGLHTLEVQEQLQRSLSEPPASGLGLEVPDVQAVLRGASFVSAAAATAMVVLAVYALRRTERVRLGLVLLAVPLAVAGFIVAGLLALAVVVGVAMLFSAPATAWFRGLPQPEQPSRTDEEAARTPEPAAQTVGAVAGTPPTSAHPVGPVGPPADPSSWPPPQGHPLPSAPARPPRPPALIWACVATWVMTGLVGGVLGLCALVVGVAGDDFFEQIRAQEPAVDESGFTNADLRTGIVLVAAVIVPWCIAAAVLAVLAFCRVAWARIALIVSAGLAGAVVLATVITSPGLVLVALPLGASVVLLARPEVRAWYRR